MDKAREAEPLDPREAKIARLEREVAALRRREEGQRAEARDARKHFSDLTAMSRRFASSMRAQVGERQQQNRRLAAQYAVGQVLDEARDLDEAAPRIYEILGERLGWHAGVLWKVDEEDGGPAVLRRAGAWCASGFSAGAFAEASEGLAFHRGEGLPGRVWERGRPVWVEDFPNDGETARAGAAARDGLRGALAFPISDGRFVGVFELFRREVLPPDENLMRTARLVGGQIAQFLERRRAEGERDLALVRERRARERATGTLESISDAFFALDEERRFTYVNRHAEKLWGRRREELAGKKVWEVFPEAVGSPFHRAVEEALLKGEDAEYEAFSPIIGIWISGRVYPSSNGVSVLFRSVEGRKRAEEALRRNEARWRALVAQGADVITISDAGGVVRFASPSIETVCGYGVEEFVGANPFEDGHFHPDDLERCAEVFRELSESPGGSATIQHRYRHGGSGEWRWLEGTFTNLFDDEAVGGLVANFRDVTERKEAEGRSRRAAELDAFRVRLTDALRGLEDAEEIKGTAARVLGERLGADRVYYAEVEPNDEYVVISRDHHLSEGSVGAAGRYRMADYGRWVFRENRANRPVFVGDVAGTTEGSAAERAEFEAIGVRAIVSYPLVKAGRLVAVLGVTQAAPRGWTEEEASLVRETAERAWAAVERARVEGALRKSEERLSAIFSGAAVGLCELARDGSFVLVNDRLCGILDRPREAVLGSSISEFTHPENLAETLEGFERLIETGEPFSVDKRYVRPDGTAVWANSTVTPLDDEARPRGALAVVVDLTERKRAEEALRRVAEVDAFRVALMDALRPLSDPARIRAEAVRVLGEHLGASRVLYAEVADDGRTAVVRADHHRDGAPPIVGRRGLDDFGPSFAEGLRGGRAFALEDLDEATGLTDEERAAYGASGIAAHVGVPLVEDGRLSAFLVVHQTAARAWAPGEVALIEEVAEHAWAAVERARAQKALRESEERYRSLAEAASSIVWTADDRGACVEEMPAWEEFTGQCFEEYEGYGWLRALHPEDRPPEDLWEELASSNPKPLEEEYRLRHRSGEYRRTIFRGVPVMAEGGTTREWVGTFLDVEERRRAEEAFAGYARLKALQADVRAEFAAGEFVDGVLQRCAEAMVEHLGVTFARVWLFDDEEEAPKLWASAGLYTGLDGRHGRVGLGELAIGRIAEEREPILTNEFASHPLAEDKEWADREGIVAFAGYPLVARGRLMGVAAVFARRRLDEEDLEAVASVSDAIAQGVARDRADGEREGLRREAERERSRLEAVLRQMPGGVFIADGSGRFVLANEGARRIYGGPVRSISECAGRALSYPDGTEPSPGSLPLHAALNGESVSGMEYYVARPDGTRRVVRANAAPVRNEEGDVVAAVKAFEDVTERKRAEAERDRSQVREQAARIAVEEAERRLAFYAGAREERQIISRELHDRVAHSIAVVRQNLELYEVLRDRNPEAASLKMEIAKEEAKATLRSTRDLSMMLRRSEVEDGLSNALAGLEETTVPEGLGYEFDVTGDESLVPPHVGNQVFLVLREAVRNATNHSGCASVRIRLRITEERLIGTVEDDGLGFDPDGARAGGGLRSMEERAALVGGEFRLRPAPEGGTAIEVSVPLRRDGA